MTRGMMGSHGTQTVPSVGKIVAAIGAVPNCIGAAALAAVVFAAANCGELLSKLTAAFHSMSGCALLGCWATDKVAPCSIEGVSSPMAPPLGGAIEAMSALPKVN